MKIKTIWQILLIFMAFLTVSEARSETCFTPAYYEKMFEQTTLESEQKGDVILVAASDPLTATGNAHAREGCSLEHGKGGCSHKHINNGRFDLLLRNAATEGPDRAPLSARILRISVGFQNQEGLLSSKWVHIVNDQIAARFGTPIAFKIGRSFDSSKGYSTNSEFLEPGENFIGCISLSKEDRTKTGKAVIEVLYEPMVWMLDLSKDFQAKPFEDKILWFAEHKIRDLRQDDVRFYEFTVPHKALEPSDIRIFLDKAQGLEVFYRKAEQGWSQDLSDWQAGELTLSRESAGTKYFLLVRSVQTSSSGTLKAEYTSTRGKISDSGSVTSKKNKLVFSPTAVGPLSTQIFKAYTFGEGDAEPYQPRP